MTDTTPDDASSRLHQAGDHLNTTPHRNVTAVMAAFQRAAEAAAAASSADDQNEGADR